MAMGMLNFVENLNAFEREKWVELVQICMTP